VRIFLFFIFKRWEKETDMMFIHGLWIFFVPLYFRSASTVSALRRRPPLWPRYDYTHLSLHSSCKIGEMSSKSVVPNSPSHRKRRRVYGGRRKKTHRSTMAVTQQTQFSSSSSSCLEGGWRGLLHARHTFTFLYLREPCV
jgi:hypothetical protein